jgi:hypothetical protein
MAYYSIHWYSCCGPCKDRGAIASTSAGVRKAVAKMVLDICPLNLDICSTDNYGCWSDIPAWLDALDALEGFKPSKVPGMCKDFEYLVPHVGTLKITVYRTNRKGRIS